jgi:hypothetical protein
MFHRMIDRTRIGCRQLPCTQQDTAHRANIGFGQVIKSVREKAFIVRIVSYTLWAALSARSNAEPLCSSFKVVFEVSPLLPGGFEVIIEARVLIESP